MVNKNLVYPTINDQRIETWCAEMLEYAVGPCAYSNGYLKAPAKIFPVKLIPTIGLRAITMTLDFMGATPYETAMHISDMTDLLQSGTEIMLPDGFLYWCEFDSASTPSRKAPWIEQVKFQLHGVRHGRIEEITLTESDNFFVDGNLETPIIVTLTPDPETETMTFQGITIESSLPVTIDGLYTTVMDSDGNNVFGSTDMTKWPLLTPGDNEIVMSGISEAKISYYPLWK